jgi:hypothetical protein
VRLKCSVGDPDPQDPHVFVPPGAGSISHRYRSVDQDPDPYQNVMDPKHCKMLVENMVKLDRFQLRIREPVLVFTL